MSPNSFRNIKAESLVPTTAQPAQEPPVAYEPEVMDLAQGVNPDDPRGGPLNVPLAAVDVRFEGKAVRRDFGWVAVGEPAQSRILALAEHKFVSGTSLFHRLVRLRQSATGGGRIEIWDGVDWIYYVETIGDETTKDQFWTPVSTLGGFYVATGGTILVWDETPTPTTRENDFPTVNDLTEEGESTVLTPTHFGTDTFEGEIIVSCEAILSVKWDGEGEGGIVTAILKVYASNDAGVTYTLVNTNPVAFQSMNEIDGETLSLTGTSAVRKTIQLRDFDLADANRIKLELSSIVKENCANAAVHVHGCNKVTDSDSFAGLEHITTSFVGTFGELSGDAPEADFIFPFAERIIAGGDGVDKQLVSWPVNGTPANWIGDGSGTTALSESPEDPIDALMAGTMLDSEVAALFRQRSIMRVIRQASSAAPLAFRRWVEGVGTESPMSVKLVRGGVFFLGHDLMPYLLTTGGLLPIGLPIHEWLIQNVTGNLNLVDVAFDQIFSDILLGVPEAKASTITAVWVFDLNRFLDKQELVWRKSIKSVGRFATVSEVE